MTAFIFADYGPDSGVLEAPADVHPGRDAAEAERGALRKAADDLQRRLEHVQAIHQGEAQE